MKGILDNFLEIAKYTLKTIASHVEIILIVARRYMVSLINQSRFIKLHKSVTLNSKRIWVTVVRLCEYSLLSEASFWPSWFYFASCRHSVAFNSVQFPVAAYSIEFAHLKNEWRPTYKVKYSKDFPWNERHATPNIWKISSIEIANDSDFIKCLLSFKNAEIYFFESDFDMKPYCVIDKVIYSNI